MVFISLGQTKITWWNKNAYTTIIIVQHMSWHALLICVIDSYTNAVSHLSKRCTGLVWWGGLDDTGGASGTRKAGASTCKPRPRQITGTHQNRFCNMSFQSSMLPTDITIPGCLHCLTLWCAVLMHSLERDLCIVKQTNDVHHEYVAIPIMALVYQVNPLCCIMSRTAIDLNTIYHLIVMLSLTL